MRSRLSLAFPPVLALAVLVASCVASSSPTATPTDAVRDESPTNMVVSAAQSPTTGTGNPAPSPPAAGAPTAFDVVVDGGQKHQTMEGFGATNLSSVYEGMGDTLSPELRAQAIEAVYGKIGITTGNVAATILESPGTYAQRRNDDNDPFHINWAGFQTRAADDVKRSIIDPAAPYGFDDYYLDQRINVRWASPWLAGIRNSDYNRFLDEAAEQVAAGTLYWHNTLGLSIRYVQLFNEALSGNGELLGGTTQQMVDLVKRVGDRLRREGLSDFKFVLPNESSEGGSLEVAKAVLADPQARQYVGAIGYHPYPYGSIYSNIANILNTSGRGRPDAGRVAVRNQLRDLGKTYGIPVWMTEVSHGGADPLSFDALRARAIHIHDELVYADAAAYSGMMNLWDTAAQNAHFGNNDLMSGANEGNLVFVDTDRGSVYISGIGYAIGHYARWIKRGAVRIEATSLDQLVLVSAFQDQKNKRLVMVLINNAQGNKDLNIQLKGVAVTGPVTGEQSTTAARWQGLAPLPPFSQDAFRITLPALSVTTIVAPTR